MPVSEHPVGVQQSGRPWAAAAALSFLARFFLASRRFLLSLPMQTLCLILGRCHSALDVRFVEFNYAPGGMRKSDMHTLGAA